MRRGLWAVVVVGVSGWVSMVGSTGVNMGAQTTPEAQDPKPQEHELTQHQSINKP